MKEIIDVLRLMSEHQASDMFCSPDNPVCLKVNGVTRALTREPLEAEEARRLIYSVMTDNQISAFETARELNFTFGKEGLGRFRANVFGQRGQVAMVVRFLADKAPDLAALNMPDHLYAQIRHRCGLVLVVGGAGSGKSTTIASLLEHRNLHDRGHILTIEDPIEYRLEFRNCVINQREVGVDTPSFEAALQHTLREAPDVLFIGEIRSAEVMRRALSYADAGVLVVSTLHAGNAEQALERMVGFFPESERGDVLPDLSRVLRAVIAQRWVQGRDGLRLPAIEVMLNSAPIAGLIRQGKLAEVKQAMRTHKQPGMIALDDSLQALFREGRITEEEAVLHADPAAELIFNPAGAGVPGERRPVSNYTDTFGSP